jgi:hypothetical protein
MDPFMMMLIGAIIASSVLTAAVTIGFFRWVKSKQRRSRIPSSIIEEMNDYSERFQKIVNDMRDVTRHIESRRSRNTRILENLREMNHLLKGLHALFEEEMQEGFSSENRERPDPPSTLPSEVFDAHHTDVDDDALNPEDLLTDEEDEDGAFEFIDEDREDGIQNIASPEFSSPLEFEKFRQLPKITKNEIENIDWDELQRRLNNDRE